MKKFAYVLVIFVKLVDYENFLITKNSRVKCTDMDSCRSWTVLPRQRNPAVTQGDSRDSYLGLEILHCSILGFRVSV